MRPGGEELVHLAGLPTVFSCFRNTRQSRLMEDPSSTSTTLLFRPSKAAEKTPCLKQSR